MWMFVHVQVVFVMMQIILISIIFVPTISAFDEPIFRYDYTYESSMNAFYKEHPATDFIQAIGKCAMENSQLVVPKSRDEIEFLSRHFSRNIWIGIHDIFVKGQFMTVEGEIPPSILNIWGEDQPNGKPSLDENCVILDQNYNDYHGHRCSKSFNFVCKVENISCGTTNYGNYIQHDFKDYVFDICSETYYKKHKKANFLKALQTCYNEGATLAIPNNNVDLLTFFSQDISPLWIGVHDILDEGDFISIVDNTNIGRNLIWKPGRPNRGSNEEDCVIITKEGLLYDDLCNNEYEFICNRPISNCNKFSCSKLNGRKHNFFRDDYQYDEKLRTFYKYHRPANFTDAINKCNAENTTLAYPTSSGENYFLCDFKKGKPKIWVGVHDLYAENHFLFLNGKHADEIFMQWKAGQPDNGGSNGEHCVALDTDGFWTDEPCSYTYGFICMKSMDDIKPSDYFVIIEKDYIFNAKTGKRYNFYEKPLSWLEANKVCMDEDASLIVVQNQKEVDEIVEMISSRNKLKSNLIEIITFIHSGFSRLLNGKDFLTVEGRNIKQFGYHKWFQENVTEFDSNSGHCGAIDSDGILFNIPCDDKLAMFICEKSLAV